MENLQNTWHTGENLTKTKKGKIWDVVNFNLQRPRFKCPCPHFDLLCPFFGKERINIPRRARIQSLTSIYHVMSRGLNKLAVFKENRERTRMLNLIRENVAKYDVEIYAYCIMPNHFHLLIKADLKELASFMAVIIAAFAKYYNRKHNRVGYVFQGRYKSQCVEDIGYFWNCLRYIHNNPLNLNEVKSIMDYKYSSMKELYHGKKDILPEIIFQLVAGRFKDPKDFYEFHKATCWSVFEDVEDESKENKLRIAKEVLEQYEMTYKTKAIEIIDYIKTKQELKQDLIKILHIPVRESDEIIRVLRKEIEGTR